MRIIGVISGKGGVGKTTTVANVGTVLASVFKRKVALIDGDPNNPDLAFQLGVYSVDKTLKEVLERQVPIRDALMELPSGVEILPAPLEAGGEIAVQDLGVFLRELDDYDVVLVDSPPGLGREIEPTFQICDEVIIVTNLEIPAVTQALKAIVTAKNAGVSIRGMVLNMVRGEKYELSAMEVELVFDAPVIGVVPEDWRVRESIAMGKPVILSSPSSSAAMEFKKLAAFLVDIEYLPSFRERLGAWLRGRFRFAEKVEVVKPQLVPPKRAEEEIAEGEKIKDEKPEIERPPRWEEFQEITVEVGGAVSEKVEEAPAQKKLENARRRAIEATLERLDKNYEKGLIRENIYLELKKKYTEELRSRD
ncbi:MAG: P-loop NTPase [Candidatus Hydrothermarchaeaceae archaeon]